MSVNVTLFDQIVAGLEAQETGLLLRSSVLPGRSLSGRGEGPEKLEAFGGLWGGFAWLRRTVEVDR